MRILSMALIAFASVFLTLGTHSSSAQIGLDSMVRQLGERAIKEIVRPDPPRVVPPSPTTPRPQEPTTPAKPTRAEIMEVQKLLDQFGYDLGLPDGLMGPNTARAISAFQRDVGARQTGRVTDALIARLRATASSRSDDGSHAKPQRAEGPSFDCARAGTPTEFAICASPVLAQMDRRMAYVYGAARANASNPSAVVDAQRSWISRRNACRSDVDCLRAVMQQRLAALQETTRPVASASAEFADPAISRPDPVDPSGALTASNTTGGNHPVTEQGIGATARDDGIRVHPSGRLIVPWPVSNSQSPEARELHALTDHLRHAILAVRIGEMDPVEAPAFFADIARDHLSPTDFQPFFCTPYELTSGASGCMGHSDATWDYSMAGGQLDMAAEHAFLWWRGATEFERRRTMNEFAQSGHLDQVIASAPELPIKLLYAIDARLQSYDFEAEHFPVAGVHPDIARLELPNRLGGPFDLSGFVHPVAAPPAAAEALTRRLEARGAGRSDLILGVEMDVDLKNPSDNRPLDAKIGAAEYFLDADATRPLAAEIAAVTGGVATAAEPAPVAATTLTGGALRQFDLQHDDDRIVMEFEGYEPTDATQEAIFYLFASAAGDVVEDFKGDLSRYVFPTLFALLDPGGRNQYFNCTVVKECRNRNTKSHFVGENEFEARQTRLAFEANVEPALVAEAPSFPIPMRMRLAARLSDYDFDKEGFDLSVYNNAQLRLEPIRYVVNLQSVFDLVPSFVPVPPDTAERLVNSGRKPILHIDFDVLSFVTNGLETITKVRPVAVVLMDAGEGGEVYFEKVFDAPDVADAQRDAAQALLGPQIAGAVASQAPTDYPVMEVAPGMTLEAAVNALSQSFSDAQITVDAHMLRAERGYCGYYLPGNDVSEDDRGAICFAASHDDQRISRVVLQQIVHPGDLRGLTEQTRASFGDPASRGDGNVPPGAMMREYFGWGEEIKAARATIGRPESGIPPHEAEVDMTYINPRVAVFTLRVDLPPTSAAPRAAAGGAAVATQEVALSSPAADSDGRTASDAARAAPEPSNGDAGGAELALLGISAGMERPEARAILEKRFGGSALARAEDGTLIAESGPCRYAAAADPAIETEVGSNCVMVVFGPDDGVSNMVVRYVVAGSHVDAYATQLEGNFGVAASRVHSEQAPDTLILGWGPELEATAAEIERDASAGQTLHALEARLTQANGVTLATARLDSEPAQSGSAATDEGDAGSAPPPIDF